MEQKALLATWETLSRIWATQIQLGRLPIYRNWTMPMVDSIRGEPLFGLTTLLISPNIKPWVVLGTDAHEVEGQPVGWRVFHRDGDDYGLIPLYQSSQLSEPPFTTSVSIPTVINVAGLITTLGYRIEEGTDQIQGTTVFRSPYGYGRDTDAEMIRAITAKEWHDRGFRGYLGAELSFGMIAAYLRLDASMLMPSRALAREIIELQPISYVNASVRAVNLCLELLSKCKLQEPFWAAFDAPFEPNTETNLFEF